MVRWSFRNVGIFATVFLFGCAGGTDNGEKEVVPKSDVGQEVVAEVVACIGTPCEQAGDCGSPGPCVSKTACENGCCVSLFYDEGTSCQEGCNIGGTCTATGECIGTEMRVCDEFDGNACTQPWCDPETGNCADQEKPLSDGVAAYKSNCWAGIVCQDGEPDDSNATPTQLNLQCQGENEDRDPFGCVGQVVCVDSKDECVLISEDDGTECWLEGGGCTGHSCVEGECKVDPGLSQECGEDDFPDECDENCRACTELSCNWIDDPANPDNPSKKVRYCKPEAQVGIDCDDGDDCTVDDACAFGSQADGPLGKETLGKCTPGEDKTKADCAEELEKPGDLDCIKAGLGCDAEEGGCYFDAAKANGWCLFECACCNDVNTACHFQNPLADEYGCIYDYYPEGTPCEDANPCTKTDQCVLAVEGSDFKKCVGTPLTEADMDDGLDCTTDTCDPQSGVKHELIEPCEEPCKFEGDSLCQPCGDCGEKCKVCVEPGTLFSQLPWGACQDEGVCAPSTPDVQDCGNCGQQESVCTDSCTWGMWGECQGEGPCSPGEIEYQSCGEDCQVQARECKDDCDWGPWGECEQQGECVPGEKDSQACGKCGTQWTTCTDDCLWGQWGVCEDEGECLTDDVQDCGNCGQQTCNELCEWGSCANQGQCVPEAEQDCGDKCGTQTCSGLCEWGNCKNEGACSPNEQAACGDCGTKTCNNSCQWGQCEEGGICSPGEQGQSQSCGNCGTKYQTCDNSCQWVWGNCQNEGVCSPNQQGSSQSCGKCGTQYQTCGNNCQWSWGGCQNEGTCSPGQQGSSQSCGNCGTQYQVCSNSCQWGSWGSCQNQGSCTPNDQDSTSCGDCGTKYKTCNGNCNWGSWGSCQNQGTCSPNDKDSTSCGDCGTKQRTCSNNCNWGSWGSCDDPCECNKSSYWEPTTMSDSAWAQGAKLTVEIKANTSNSGVKMRVCKSSGTFDNHIHVWFQEWYKNMGLNLVNKTVNKSGQCTVWTTLDYTSQWKEGEGLGGEIQVISPTSCWSNWGWTCNNPPEPGCGGCWWFDTSVMKRTCKQ